MITKISLCTYLRGLFIPHESSDPTAGATPQARNAAIANGYFTAAINRVGTEVCSIAWRVQSRKALL